MNNDNIPTLNERQVADMLTAEATLGEPDTLVARCNHINYLIQAAKIAHNTDIDLLLVGQMVQAWIEKMELEATINDEAKINSKGVRL